MAKKVSVDLIDDLDGSHAAESVVFSLDGNAYEIDLSEKNASALRESLSTWVQKARRTSGVRRVRRSTIGVDLAAVRTWAQANGYQVAPRGRVAKQIIDAYQKSGSVSPTFSDK